MDCTSTKQHYNRYAKASGPMKIRRRRKSSSGASMCTTIHEVEMRQCINSIFDKYDVNHDEELQDSQVRNMIKELSLAKKKNLSKEELELHVKAFYNHIKTNEEGMITRESFYNYYKKQ